jgi:hypothetical protein
MNETPDVIAQPGQPIEHSAQLLRHADARPEITSAPSLSALLLLSCP